VKKILAMAIAAGFVFVSAGCGGAHPKIEDKKDESGKDVGRVGFSSDPQVLQQQQQEIQQQQMNQQVPQQQ